MGIFRNVQEKLKNKGSSSTITEDAVKAALSNVIDPDLGRDIVSLGFVTKIEIKGTAVHATVNLTTPACPVKDQLKRQCEQEIAKIPHVTEHHVTMTATTRGRSTSPQDALHASLGGVRNIIGVASGKGGVGKSTTTVNLAWALAKSGSKVGILDADIYGPSIPHMTRSGQPSGGPNNRVVPPEVDGIKVISVSMFGLGEKAAILRGPMAASVIKQFLMHVEWGELDYLIIDYPPGTGDIQLTLSQSCPITGIVLVSTPQEVSLLDVRKAISMFETTKVPIIGVVETMSYYEVNGEKHYIFGRGGGEKIAREYGLPILGQIPIEPEVTQSCDQGTPIVGAKPDSLSSKAYLAAAGSVAQQVAILQSQDQDALTSFRLEWKANG